jgi:hypothetical protein
MNRYGNDVFDNVCGRVWAGVHNRTDNQMSCRVWYRSYQGVRRRVFSGVRDPICSSIIGYIKWG